MEPNIYERIKTLCEDHGIRMTELIREVGISESLIRKWKTGSSPSIDKLLPIARFFEVSLDYLVGTTDIPLPPDRLVEDDELISAIREFGEPGENNAMRYRFPSGTGFRVAERYSAADIHTRNIVDFVLDERQKASAEPPVTKLTRKIPLFGNSFAAGIGEPDFGNALEEYEVDADVRADFAVRINGDSMEPYLHDGSIALGVKGKPQIGDVVAILVDGAFYVKQFVQDNYGNLYLLAGNRKRKDTDLTIWASSNSTVACFGVIPLCRRIPIPHG